MFTCDGSQENQNQRMISWIDCRALGYYQEKFIDIKTGFKKSGCIIVIDIEHLSKYKGDYKQRLYISVSEN